MSLRRGLFWISARPQGFAWLSVSRYRPGAWHFREWTGQHVKSDSTAPHQPTFDAINCQFPPSTFCTCSSSPIYLSITSYVAVVSSSFSSNSVEPYID
ncbi:hypothetical protein VTN96DRAFT_4360 [Rasamsonia emersonii]